MYYFMYVDPDTITTEDHFPDTKQNIVDYKKISTPGKGPKHWIGFNHIHSKDY